MKQFLSHESSSEKMNAHSEKAEQRLCLFAMQKILVYPLFA